MPTALERFGAAPVLPPLNRNNAAQLPQAPAPVAVMGRDGASFSANRPLTAASLPADQRAQMEQLRGQLAQLSSQITLLQKQLDAKLPAQLPSAAPWQSDVLQGAQGMNCAPGCICPCCGGPKRMVSPELQGGLALPNPYQPSPFQNPAQGLQNPYQHPAGANGLPAWCKPGDPTCDPHANPSLLRPSWCQPGDPRCDPSANPSLLRPSWCTPGDPTCDPSANPSLLRPSWCTPGDPSCDPAAALSLLRPSWCQPGDPRCDPAANPSLLRPSWCQPGDPTCDPSANPLLLLPHFGGRH